MNKQHHHHHKEQKPEQEPVKAEETPKDAASQAPEAEAKSAEQSAKPEPAPAEKAAAEIESLKKALSEAEDKRIRTLAEMDNLRKRLSKDMESQRFAIQADTLSAFLQVYDHFTMAVAASNNSDNLKALLEGMKMISAEFGKAFQELGAEFISAEGKDFDPNLHEALSQESSDSVPAGKVIRQWSTACKLGQRLLRPARVIVSSGPAKPEGEAAKA